MINEGFFEMHGRGFYLNVEIGELYEGIFENNKFLSGRCIYNSFFYISSSKSNFGTYYNNDGGRSRAIKNDEIFVNQGK